MKRNFVAKVLSMVAAAALLGAMATGCANTPKINQDAAGQTAGAALKAAAGGGTESQNNNGISVSGQGIVNVKPDVATIRLGVETSDADAAKARAANDTAMTKVIAAVKTFGVADGDIETTDFNINPRYDEKGQKITGYAVSNTISVKVKNLDKLGDVIQAAGDAGANTAGGIGFDVADRTAAYNDALTKAMAQARARADVMAKACGVTLGKALTINESSTYSGPTYADNQKMELAKAAGDSVPVSSGQLEVTANVSVVYEIVK